MNHPARPALDEALRFPKPPFRIDGLCLRSPPPDRAVANYLDQIRAWRSAVQGFIRDAGSPGQNVPGMSDRACCALDTFLELRWSPSMSEYAAQCPYNIAAFPVAALETDRPPAWDTVLEVLRWRFHGRQFLGSGVHLV